MADKPKYKQLSLDEALDAIERLERSNASQADNKVSEVQEVLDATAHLRPGTVAKATVNRRGVVRIEVSPDNS